MKLVAPKILILCALITITQEIRLKTKKLSLTSVRTRKLKKDVSADFLKAVNDELDKYGLETNKSLGKGGYGEVFDFKKNPNLVVKAIEYKFQNSSALAESEIRSQRRVEGSSFSLPLCKVDTITINEENRGVAMILPKAQKDLFTDSDEWFNEYMKMPVGLFDPIKNIGIKLLSGYKEKEKDEKRYKKYKPKLKRFVQMALGLEEFHKTGLVHRDVKPKNYLIMKDINSNERIVLADFGLAIEATDADVDGFGGTSGYTPEEANQQKNKTFLTQKLDTFALGVTYLYTTVIHFHGCIKNFYKCNFNELRGKITDSQDKKYKIYKEFRDYLKKNVTRFLSEVEKKVEDLVFTRLLTDWQARFTSKQLVSELEKIAPDVVNEVKDEIKNNPITCPTIREIKPVIKVGEKVPNSKENIINIEKQPHQVKSEGSKKKSQQSQKSKDIEKEV